MRVLLLFHFATLVNSQNPNETDNHNELKHINLYTSMMLVFTIGIFEVSTTRK